MGQPLEFEGKNVEEAVERACEAIHIPKTKLKYDVLSYGSTGIFGLVGSKKARIRVTVQRPPVEQDQTPPRTGERGKERQTQTEPEKRSGPALDPAVDVLAAAGEDALRRILNTITTDVHITVETGPEEVLFNVRGGNSALLIGKRGQTLDAIQYLVEKIVHRKTEQRIRVRVDVEGYQQNRRMSLQRLAEKVSEKVKKTGRPVTLGDLNASDRRIVHMALKNDQEVRTQSKGGGALKKLFVYPRKKQPSNPKP